MFRFLILSLVLLCFAAPSSAQDLSARDIVRMTIKSSGGESWRRPQTLHLKGTATLFWKNTPYKMERYEMWREFPSQNDSARSANGKVRFDAVMEGGKQFFQIAFDGQNTVQNLSDEARQQEELLRWGNNFGFSIFRFADTRGFEVVRLPDDRVDGYPCYMIKIVDAKENQTIFGVDRQRFIIRYAAFKTPIGFHERIYSDFKWNENPRFIQPKKLRVRVDGVKIADVFWREFEINKAIAASVFSIEQS